MMLGHALLVAPVVEPGVASREIYLPAGTRWFDFWSGEVFEGGRTVTRPAPFRRPPLLAREGSIIALNTAEQHFSQRADTRAFQIFPLTRGTFEADIYDDDGESAGVESRRFWHVRVACTDDAVDIAVGAQENGAAVSCDAEIILPATEKRRVSVSGGRRV
jgi:alpha-glucosidase